MGFPVKPGTSDTAVILIAVFVQFPFSVVRSYSVVPSPVTALTDVSAGFTLSEFINTIFLAVESM